MKPLKSGIGRTGIGRQAVSRSLDSVAAAHSVGRAFVKNPVGGFRWGGGFTDGPKELTQVLKRFGQYRNVCLTVTPRDMGWIHGAGAGGTAGGVRRVREAGNYGCGRAGAGGCGLRVHVRVRVRGWVRARGRERLRAGRERFHLSRLADDVRAELKKSAVRSLKRDEAALM